MKSLQKHLMEAIKYTPGKIIPLKGRLEWKFKSKDYGVDEHANCDGWNAGFCKSNGDCILIFWSPNTTWMPYVYVDEALKNKINWALVSRECEANEVSSIVLANFDGYCADAATVPELDTVEVPKEAQKLVDNLK